MADEQDRLRKIQEELERLKHVHAEEYAFCGLHNRRYPQGAQCPSCAAEMKKNR